MDGLNLDPGLRQAYTKQTQQRFLAEANNARILKSTKSQKTGPRKLKQFSFGGKVKAIGHIIRESGSEILNVIRTKNGTAQA
jgi:hypothetical protein